MFVCTPSCIFLFYLVCFCCFISCSPCRLPLFVQSNDKLFFVLKFLFFSLLSFTVAIFDSLFHSVFAHTASNILLFYTFPTYLFMLIASFNVRYISSVPIPVVFLFLVFSGFNFRVSFEFLYLLQCCVLSNCALMFEAFLIKSAVILPFQFCYESEF